MRARAWIDVGARIHPAPNPQALKRQPDADRCRVRAVFPGEGSAPVRRGLVSDLALPAPAGAPQLHPALSRAGAACSTSRPAADDRLRGQRVPWCNSPA